MRVTAFRGESSVGAIAEKVYEDLSPASRKKAVAALLKANPQLERLEKVKPGTVLRIPEVPGVRVTPGRGPEGPADEIAGILSQRLEAYGKSLAERYEAFQADMKDQATLLKDRQFLTVVAASPVAELAVRADKAIHTQAKAAEDIRERLDAAIKKLTLDLSRR